jgi:hypothetical protein
MKTLAPASICVLSVLTTTALREVKEGKPAGSTITAMTGRCGDVTTKISFVIES